MTEIFTCPGLVNKTLSVLKFCYLRFHSHVISVASPFNVLCLSQRSIGQSTRK